MNFLGITGLFCLLFHPLNNFVRVCFLVQLFFMVASPCLAEELEPRRWAHIPIDTDFFGSGYAYTEADIGFDPVLKIENVDMEMDTWVAKYIRSFSLFEKTARVSVLQAYQEGRWSGLLDGTPKKIKRSGLTDTRVRFAINLYGAPPLKGKEYAEYRAKTRVETIVGAAFSVRLPTGDYMDDKLINLGKNRFAFRPQIGVVHTRDKWTTEVTAEVAFYTDNDDFFNGKKLEKKPLLFTHAHLIRDLGPGERVRLSLGYDYGGENTVDGEDKDNRSQNTGWVLGYSYSIKPQYGTKISYSCYLTE